MSTRNVNANVVPDVFVESYEDTHEDAQTEVFWGRELPYSLMRDGI
jgi:hypothetical protein